MTDAAKNPVTTPMPAYTHTKTQKTVHAAQITGVGQASHGFTDLLVEPGMAPIPVDKAFMTKHAPKVGGYCVQNEEGDITYVAADAFAAGYTLVPPGTVDDEPRVRTGRLRETARSPRPLTAGKYFTTANRAAAPISAERFDPIVKPWPTGVVDDAASETHYSIGGGLNQPGHVVAPGDWIVTDAQGERRPMSPADFEGTYTALAIEEADPMALEKFLRRVPRPVLTVGVAANGVTFRLASIDQSEVLEGVVEGNTWVVTPAPRTTNV